LPVKKSEEEKETPEEFFHRIKHAKKEYAEATYNQMPVDQETAKLQKYECDMFLIRVSDGLIGKVCLRCGNPNMEDAVTVDRCDKCWTADQRRYLDEDEIDGLRKRLRAKMNDPKFKAITDRIIKTAQEKGMM